MDNLYLEIYSHKNESHEIQVSLETLIIYFVFKHCQCTSININFVIQENAENQPCVTIDGTKIKYNILLKESLPAPAKLCTLPNAIIKNVVTSGICSVARLIIKNCPPNHISRKLLGFREACVMACNESSIWTKFCEIDIVETTKNLLQNFETYFEDVIRIPKDLTRFEFHMSQPVRIHNIYKVAQDQARQNKQDSTNITTSTPKEHLDLPHLYAEGPYMTLSDIILYPLVCIIHNFYGNVFETHLPLTFKWYKNMKQHVELIDIKLPVTEVPCGDKNVHQENVPRQSLYISDPLRYKPRNRNFTKQPDINLATNIIASSLINIHLSDEPYGSEMGFNWSQIPEEAHPEGGALPKSRAKRKLEQLENLGKAVIKLARPGQTIVDFCSGSGHLGILIAVQLPSCKVVLLENKEVSLTRAKNRVEKLRLENVTLLQCNLDYFVGDFDVGVSLHACGVATDLVIQHCIKRNAAFVSCPCCYGGVHVCHHLTYPRSKLFCDSALTLKDYLVLGHAADQTHGDENAKTKQGILCMDIIDTDRKLHAEEFGYKVILSKMIPQSCTPKNNLLVGIPHVQKVGK